MRYTQLKDRKNLIDSIFRERETRIFNEIINGDIRLMVYKYFENDFPSFKYAIASDDELKSLLHKMSKDLVEALKYNYLLQDNLDTYKLDKKEHSITSITSFNELKQMGLIKRNRKSIQNNILNDYGVKNFTELPFLDELIELSENGSKRLGFIKYMDLFQAYYLYGMYTSADSNIKPFKQYKTVSLASDSENSNPKLWNPDLSSYCKRYTNIICSYETIFLNLYCFELEFNHLLSLEILKQTKDIKINQDSLDRLIFVLSHLTFLPTISHHNLVKFFIKYGETDSYSAMWALESINATLNFAFIIWPLLTQRFKNNLANFKFNGYPETEINFDSIRNYVTELLKDTPDKTKYDEIQEINSILCMSITDEVLEEIWKSEISTEDVLMPNGVDKITCVFNPHQFDEYKIRNNIQDLLKGNLEFFLKNPKIQSEYPSNESRILANRKWAKMYHEMIIKKI